MDKEVKRFYVDPDIIDPGNHRYNLVEPSEDTIFDNGVDELQGVYNTDEDVSLEIVTRNGNWDSMGKIKNIYTDEFGVILSVEVDWGAAVLIESGE